MDNKLRAYLTELASLPESAAEYTPLTSGRASAYAIGTVDGKTDLARLLLAKFGGPGTESEDITNLLSEHKETKSDIANLNGLIMYLEDQVKMHKEIADNQTFHVQRLQSELDSIRGEAKYG